MHSAQSQIERALHQISDLSHEELKALAVSIRSDPTKLKAFETLYAALVALKDDLQLQ